MARNYTKREMASLLSCSAETINTDCEWFKFVPEKGDRGTNLYSAKQYQLIAQMRKHCDNGKNTRDSFVPIAIPEILEENAIIRRMKSQVAKLPVVESLQSLLIEKIKDDPFADLELLQRISDNKWLLPAVRLAPILRISAKYLNSLTKYEYCGFIATKEIYSHNVAYWKVEANNS